MASVVSWLVVLNSRGYVPTCMKHSTRWKHHRALTVRALGNFGYMLPSLSLVFNCWLRGLPSCAMFVEQIMQNSHRHMALVISAAGGSQLWRIEHLHRWLAVTHKAEAKLAHLWISEMPSSAAARAEPSHRRVDRLRRCLGWWNNLRKIGGRAVVKLGGCRSSVPRDATDCHQLFPFLFIMSHLLEECEEF